MKIEGGCHCGYIKFEADINPDTASICHCTDCQTLTGSAYRTNVRANKGTFKLVSGQPKIYIKTAESGNKRAHGFCPECGTPIYSTTVTDPQEYGLRVGTIRQRSQIKPKSQGWCRSAQSWVMDLSGMPQSAKQRA
jgi:hypothetical protein